MNISLLYLLLLSIITYLILFYIGSNISNNIFSKNRFYFSAAIGYGLYSYILNIAFMVSNNRYFICIINILFIVFSIFINKKNKYYINFNIRKILILLISGIIGFLAVNTVIIKISGDMYSIANPIFDHVKVAITSSIVNNGVPISNPFIAFPENIFYYYLFYIPCASITIFFNISPYESEIIFTFISTIISINLIYGGVEVLRKKEISYSAIIIGALLILSGNIRAICNFSFLSNIHGIDTFFSSACWVPQHLMSAIIFILTLFIVYVKRIENIFIIAILLSVSLGLSSYIGGFVSCFSLICIILYNLYKKDFDKKSIIKLAVITLIFSIPFIINQFGAVLASHSGALGYGIYKWSSLPKYQYILFNIIGFFTIYLFVQIPAIYVPVVVLFNKIRCKKYYIFYITLVVSLFISCFIKTTIANNDLGWRSILVFVVISTVFSIYYISILKNKIKIIFIIIGLTAISPSIYMIEEGVHGNGKKHEILSLESIQAIQNNISTNERYLNNFHVTDDIDPWNGNVLFSIFSQRNSCFASYSYIDAFGDRSKYKYKKSMENIFNTEFSYEDLENSKKLKCDKYIYYKTDKNFNNDAYIESFGLKKIYQNNQIKIYH